MAVEPGTFKFPVLAQDPTTNPEAGKVFLYVVGSSYRMKNSSGTVFTFATGITPEDVQDIVGTFIAAGSSKLSINYDDVNNVLILDVVPANILHQQLSGAGSNTHAQIDSHISNTSNPHGTTAGQVGADPAGTAAAAVSAHESALDPHSQYTTVSEAAAAAPVQSVAGKTGVVILVKADVGLSNVDNTSDANKPISSATQTALNLKYDASNPSGFETPAQLNARDTANRSRANHTGTQLAATISDFSASVLALVLTGFSVGANAALAATDTILQAFGKLQGQINAINAILLTQILGDQFEEFSDLSTFTTTANTNQVAASFVTASKPAGKYRLAIEWNWSYNSTNNDAIASIWVDGVQVSQEFRYELSDATLQLLNNHWFYYPTFATTQTHTVELRVRSENAGSTHTVTQVRAEIWRVQ